MTQSHPSDAPAPASYSEVLDLEANFVDTWIGDGNGLSEFNIHMLRGVQAYLRNRAENIRKPFEEEEN